MTAQRLPNLLFLMADDHSNYVLGCEGNLLAQTPNLDRLASQGVRLANHFCNSPVSSPSRQSILTGRMPHATGVTVNANSLDETIPTLAKQLTAHGYDTAAIGVMHFNRPGTPGLHGFATAMTEDVIAEQWRNAPYDPIPETVPIKPPWKPFKEPARIWLNADKLPFPRFERDMESSLMVSEAESFLEAHVETPFALWVSFPEPHSPYNFPVEDAEAYSRSQFTPPAVVESDHGEIPLIFRDLTTDDKKGIIAAYYTSVRYLDRTVGRVLDKLDALGLAENTLVVYLPDHGYSLGQHGRFEKHTCYEQSLRIPCILRMPDRLAPRVIRDLTESADIAPTILDLLDLPPLPDTHGQSLSGLVTRSSTNPPHEYVFCEYLGNQEACVRTLKWKFIHCAGQRARTDGYVTDDPAPGRYVRLFDLTNGPDELTNVADTHPDVVATMSEYMLDRFRSTHPAAKGEPAGMDVGGAIDWYLVGGG